MTKIAKRISIVIPFKIDEQGLSLYVQLRREDGPLDGLWEFPGGKIEIGEAPEFSALREFEEEVGLKLGPEDLTHFSTYDFAYEDRSLVFFIYTLDLNKKSDMKHGLSEQKITWESAKNDVESANIPEANKHFLMQFIEFKKSQLGMN
ncbi:NUDIX domain-containing protein [Bacteriovorax sp. DB6_IX]|uniref:NUDIX domain-containing protein n=1 Tax=Bacteriovorax sp. DB6_IX TaxID=1353530 RepID=UPI00038A49B4|nr:NUDIX domain-containing protein [Bacteriovorax sp. DB6_IX]EQC45962.1 mutator mutT protein [Bacteriovorax sp. DB6_IX]